ncbi:hypothetical protein TgHK011_007599 [Trichoderma gracile]|nr:hypothetical protein TgHK011_007599 [Trichoderma gracile]
MADDVGGIFSGCAIAFVPSDSLAPNLTHSLGTILIDNGAEIVEPRRDGSIPIERVTHIISNTIDFPQYVETQAVMIPVITTQWITVSISRRKQAQVRPFSPDPGMIFSEVVVTCADLPLMDKESILGAVMALGGQESKDASRLCTHICALSMDHPKVVAALERNWKGKIVLPHWFDDCFKLGKRIDEKPYLLPDPEILKRGADEDLDIPTNKNLVGASSANPEFLPLSSDNSSRPPVTVFQDKSILLCKDLKLTARLENALKDIIEYGGGRVVEDVDECDTLICGYRDGDEYVRASQACKDVGNLSWLYFLIVRNEWSSPLRRLLHYPIPRGGIPGFQDKRITVSNYGGEARIYLENLIKACGAEFTRTMKTDNTHLITARNSSEKCKAAPEWGITVVNHLWIEESYAKCEMQPVNVKKYNHFPSRTNLGEIIGQTSFNESRLRDLYYPGGEHTMSLSAKRKRKILEAAENNAYSHGPAEGVVIPEAGQKNLDVMELDKEEVTPASRKNRRDARQLVTPARSQPARADKENETPMIMSSGGRSAKSKAMDKLSSIAPDIALYEKEKKRTTKPGTPFGGKKAVELTEKEKGSAKKSAARKDGDDEERPAKKSRPSLPGIEMRVILTGFPRWVGNQTKEDQDRRKLRDLGIQIVQEGHPCDYLAAPHVVRTVKFLCALARGPTVISSAFIDQILETGKIPEVEKFLLKDDDAEAKYNINLQQSVARAKAHRGKLLRNVGIYCTDKVRNGPDSYRTIAEANGATFKIYRARSGSTIKPTTAEQDNFLPPDPVYLLSGNSAEEKQLWPRFREMAEKGHMEPRIVSPDWLLDVAMAQQVRFDKKFLIDAE